MNRGDFKINFLQQTVIIEMVAVIAEDRRYKVLQDRELDSLNV